jgi:hypothetical protein
MNDACESCRQDCSSYSDLLPCQICIVLHAINCISFMFSCLYRASTVLKHFTVPTDALNNIIYQNCKIVKTLIFAPTRFGSYKNHPQGAIQYLAKTTDMDLLCSSAWTQSLLWQHMILCTCVRCV